MRIISVTYRKSFYILLVLILSGCMSFSSAKFHTSKEGYRELRIEYPTGEYQASHNIFMPYQEAVEIYTIVLRALGSKVDGKDIVVYRFSDLDVFKVTGFVELQCKRGKTEALIELYLLDGKAFDGNGKYDLKENCERP